MVAGGSAGAGEVASGAVEDAGPDGRPEVDAQSADGRGGGDVQNLEANARVELDASLAHEVGAPSDGGTGSEASSLDAEAGPLVCSPTIPVNRGDDWVGCSATCGVCNPWPDVFDLYEQHHPGCRRAAESCAGAWKPCGEACPVPSGADVSCNGQAGNWQGCRGTGCSVAPERVVDYPFYFQNHSLCQRGPATGNVVACSGACPPPGPADAMDGNGSSGGWDGCRGNGLWVCTELLTGFPRYFVNHPLCQPNPTCHDWSATCNSACPAPSAADR